MFDMFISSVMTDLLAYSMPTYPLISTAEQNELMTVVAALFDRFALYSLPVIPTPSSHAYS